MGTKKLVTRKSKKALTTSKKMKIQKKVRQHDKKMRREARRARGLGLKKRKRRAELRVPNLNPEKRELLEALLRRRGGDEAALRGLQAKGVALSLPAGGEAAAPGGPAAPDRALYTDARSNFRSLNYVLENADVIVEVLDARYPEACRCRALERRLAAKHVEKKLVLVLNKIDLVPPEVALMWQRALAAEYPTVLFRANRQEQRAGLSGGTLFAKSLATRPQLADGLLRSSKALGCDKLLELVKNYARNDLGQKNAITVGVVGFPNVGKSSVINSLARRRAAQVSSVPGFTRSIQRVEIDRKVDVIDCPGIIPNVEEEATLLLRNSIRPHQVRDVEAAIEEIARRVDAAQLGALYGCAPPAGAQELLLRVAEARGKLKRGGVLDLDAAARIVLHDWCEGNIKYYTLPPHAPAAGMRLEQ